MDYRKINSAKEILAVVWKHFLLEDKPLSIVIDDEKIACRYRRSDGARCAVGVFIPDNEYDSSYENFNAKKVGERANKLGHVELSDFLSLHATLLRDLQRIHDTAHTTRPNKEYFKEDLEWMIKNITYYTVEEVKELAERMLTNDLT